MTNPMTTDQDRFDHPRTLRAFGAVRALLAALFVISVAAVTFAIVEHANSELVNTVVWIRSIAVVAAAVLLYGFAVLAARGKDWAYRRLRLLAFLIPCGVVLLVAAPGEFPLWIKIEQVACGLLILTTGIILSSSHVRSLFPKPVKSK